MLAVESQPLSVDRLRQLAQLIDAPYTQLRDASLRDAGYFGAADPVRAGTEIHLVSLSTLDGVSPVHAFTDADEARRYAELLDRVDGGLHEVSPLGLDTAEWPEPYSLVEASWSNRTGRIQTRNHVVRQLPHSLTELRISYASDETQGIKDAIYLITTTDTDEGVARERVERVLRDAPSTGPGALAAASFNALAGTPSESLENSIAYATASYGHRGAQPSAAGISESPSNKTTNVLPPSVSAELRAHAQTPTDSDPMRGRGAHIIQRRTVVIRDHTPAGRTPRSG